MANLPSLSVVREQAKLKKLGRYELEECLGVEGGRETYRARVRGLAGFDRIFAVKCLRRKPGVTISRTDPFIVAAKRVGSVIDARVARVLDVDVIEGVAVAVTEFVHGLDLDRFREWAQVSGELATGADPAAEKWQRYVAYIGAEIAAALAAMHALGPPLVHGGLSPRNVIITERGGLKLLDVGLGIAAQKAGDALSARAQAYAAPGPLGAEPTAANDVRALGAMLFELATGELPPAGVTSAAARRLLEAHWSAMADFISSMLAEDPALRPRAAAAVDVLSGRYGGTADAAMVGEMATLVRNFSAFVADGAAPSGPATSGVEPEPADRFPPAASGMLSVAPPAAPVEPPRSASSGSFLATSDQATRVSPDSGYASAIFRALPSEGAAPTAPETGPVPGAPLSSRISVGPGPVKSPAARSFAAIKGPDLPALKIVEPRAAAPGHQAPPPVLAAGPLAKSAPMPGLPPPPVIQPPVAAAASMRTMLAPPAPPVLSPPASPMRTMLAPPAPPVPSPPASPMRTMLSPPAPAAPASPRRTMLSPPAPAVPSPPAPAAVAEPMLPPPGPPAMLAEPEPVAEVADWGAQALKALGTQAGVPISLVPSGPGEVDHATSLADTPPLVSDPGIEEAFAFAPHPPPPAENWVGPQPVSQGATMSPIQAPEFAPPERQELLEEELLEDEPTPLLVSTVGGGGDGLEPAPAAADETETQMEASAEAAEPSGPALEATAFITDDESASPSEPEPLRVAQTMTSPEDGQERRPKSRSAQRSRASRSADRLDAVEDEGPKATTSRTKKIVAVLAVAAGLGAGAAALTIGPSGKKGAAPPTLAPPRVQKQAAVKVVPKGEPAEKAAVAAAEKATPGVKAAPAANALTAGKAASAGKTALAEKVAPTATEPPAAKAPAGKTPPALAEKNAGKPQAEAPVVASAKSASAAAELPGKAARPLLPETPVKAQDGAGTASKPTPAVAAMLAGPPGAAVRVSVASQPAGATVWIDGEERGQTPLTASLKPGTARVALVHAGYLTSQSTLEVRDGAAVDETLKAVEPPMTGEARFRAECQTTGKFPIVVDGKETGILCPFSKMRVEPGTHTVGLLIPATGKVHQKEVVLFAGVRSVVFGD